MKVLTVVMEKAALLNYKKIFSTLKGSVCVWVLDLLSSRQMHHLKRKDCGHTYTLVGGGGWYNNYNHL